MAEIVLATSISGTRNGKDWPPRGSKVDLPADEAASMIAGGLAFAPDDPRVAELFPGLTPLDLAGAPEARDRTEGQPDTNLARAQAMAKVGDKRAAARKAAKEVGVADEDQAARSGNPVVGDDQPDPVGGDSPAVGYPRAESAALAPAGEQAADTSKPAARGGRA